MAEIWPNSTGILPNFNQI
jgi:hypothetical protein